MKLNILASFLLFFNVVIFAQIPTGYYNNADGKSGYELKTALYNIIKGHTQQSYTSLWTHFKTTDKKSNGTVWDMYSDVPGGTPAYVYIFVEDQCGNYSGEGSCYNREHSWPKSWFDDGYPMYTDLFHLYPTDGYTNGKRGNYPFGEVDSPTWTSTNGSKLGNNSTDGYSSLVFEPIDEYKGDFARSYFYMATRYENVISSWVNNTGASQILDGSNEKVFKDWQLQLLFKWHNNDPVSDKEINRNNDVYGIQNNRNPFIDHPEYVALIWTTETSVKNNSLEDFNLYPNPSNGIITITGNFNDSENILSFYNNLGQLVYRINKPNFTQSQVNISHLSKGVYYLKIKAKNKQFTTKKVILH
ncbi:endonuclease [Carboxylicivirga caseinilyticus]|uniref:endonuclease n=1 Tax=Carboxylicivirga caseinilyticus TaxID=3417572 RepID=UPI003D34A16F|nr:endonuclease [Marinilabiliaceae bacterium A049]